ncbi:serine/threonine-protein kinase [Marinicella sp. W31]|uniref:serine/threonine-protein kinase n=1 Tax=Marinicella sp. W31 TaxID=3023713 RepID=UPI003757EA88
MSKKKILSKEQIIAAIDKGLTLEIDLAEISDAAERDELEVLLEIARVSATIKKKQDDFMRGAIQPGDHWAHLVIKEKIGSGGFGQVFRAYDTVLQTEVAVKFLNPQTQLYINVDDFLEEARLMATVRNPHVLAIHGAATDKGVAGYWSDYLNGEVLFNRLRDEGLGNNEQLKIITQLIQAVKATHDNGIVHGDIKSLNVMLQPNRGAILLDFGSSRSGLEEIESSETIQASPIAMAPEQFTGQPSSQASDIFTLGLLLVEILTSQHLLINKDMAGIKDLINRLPEYLRTLSLKREWRNLLTQMLQPDPDLRPSIGIVDKAVQHIQLKPVKRAKKIALTTTILLLLSVTALSLYNNWSIRQVNQQKDAINDILFDIFLTVSPYPEGKNTKLVDALKKAELAISNNQVLPSDGKHRLLVRLVGTFLSLSDLESTLEYADKVLQLEDLEIIDQMHMHDFKGRVYLHKRDLAQAQVYYQKIVDAEGKEIKEVDQKINALSYLYYIALQQNDMEEIGLIQKQIDQLLPISGKKPSVLSKIAYNQGLYYSRLNEYKKSAKSLHKAADYQQQLHHSEHYTVLTYRSVAAQVFATSGKEELIQQGIQELEAIIIRMNASMGEKHSNTIAAYMNLASAYNRSGESGKAIEILEKIQPIVHEKYGENSIFVVKRFYQNLASAYEQNKRLDDALAMINLQIQILTEHHPDQLNTILTTKLDLAKIQFNHQLLNESKALTLNVLNEAMTSLGENHRLTLEAEQFLSIIDYETSKQPDIKAMNELLEKQTKILSDNDPLIIEFRKKIKDRQ